MYLEKFYIFKQSNQIRFWTLTNFTFLNLTKSDHPFGLFGAILRFFPQNLSNQYVLNLWLIFQKPIRFGIDKVIREKENEFKMQLKIL